MNGALLTIQIGPFSGQPTELIKVILVIFLAGYLSDFRPLLVEASMRLGPLRLPPVPYLLPMLAMWAIALGIVVIQRDLGAALLFFAVFLALVYIATARASYVVIGLLLFVAGSVIAYQLFGTVRDRVDIWLNPFVDASGKGYQVVQSLYAFGRGGIVGTGLGAGLPLVGGRLPIPAIHTDFPFAALGEELGLIGVVAILGLYLIVIERGLRIAASAADDFRSLLAAGLTLVVGVQAFIIAAGNLKLIPLTGVTLPFISYGGSSLLANGVVIGLLLALSDRGVEPPPPPPARTAPARPSWGDRGRGPMNQPRPGADRTGDRPNRPDPQPPLRPDRRRRRLLAGGPRLRAQPGGRQPAGDRRRPGPGPGHDPSTVPGRSWPPAGTTPTASPTGSTPIARWRRSSAMPRRSTGPPASSGPTTPS